MSNTATLEETKAEAKQPTWEDDDLVTVIHRNWGAVDRVTRQPLIPMDRETYLDRITFVGGVGRNIPYDLAKKWVKLGLIAKEHIFPNTAQAEDFAEATGRTPMSPQDLASAVAELSPEKAAALLGDEAALDFAKRLQRLVSARQKEADDGTR